MELPAFAGSFYETRSTKLRIDTMTDSLNRFVVEYGIIPGVEHKNTQNLRVNKYFGCLIIIAVLLLAGCSAGESPDRNPDLTATFESAVGTAIVETIAAALPDTDDTPGEPQPEEEGSQQPSPEPSATLQIQASQTPIQGEIEFTPTPTDPPVPCYRAELVAETIPDGTVLPPSTGFIKIWDIQNTGVCEWTADFRWVLTDGIDFFGPRELRLNRSVMPGEVMQVVLELGTPNELGDFKSTYKIFTDQNTLVTPNGFWISVVVEEAEN